MRKRRIVVMGFMGSMPIAGVIWQHLHYIIGLQRLGHEVYYVEDSGRYPYDPVTFNTDRNYTYAVSTLRNLAEAFGFQDRWAYSARFLEPAQSFGLSLDRLRNLYLEADAILNICGAQELHEDLLRSERLIYVESDPGVEQIVVDKGHDIHKYLGHYQALFTYGENIGTNSFPVPLHGLQWLPTRQPVVTDFWKTEIAPGSDAVFTTVSNWSTGGRNDITWNGDTYLWSKSENFLKFIKAPEIVGETLEMVTDIKDASSARDFRSHGWRLTDPYGLSANYEAYRRYIQAARGEFTVAKDQYVRLNTGWFSDRSACFLAAGRPVITQETGFTRLYGGKKGLFAFSDFDDIQEAASAIKADYAAHSRAAYEIAQEFFAADKVLTSFLDRAGV